MRSVLKDYKKELVKYNDILWEDYTDIDIDEMWEEAPWSRAKKEKAELEMSSDREFLLEVIEQTTKLIDMITDYEDAE